jgi:hypothetical protein
MNLKTRLDELRKFVEAKYPLKPKKSQTSDAWYDWIDAVDTVRTTSFEFMHGRWDALFSVCLASAREVISFGYWRFCTPGSKVSLVTSRDLGSKISGPGSALVQHLHGIFKRVNR